MNQSPMPPLWNKVTLGRCWRILVFLSLKQKAIVLLLFFMPILGRARPADRWVLESLLGGTWKILCCGLFRGVLMGFRGLQSRKNGWPEGCLWTWGSKKFGEREVFSSVRKMALHGLQKVCGLVDKNLLHFRYVGVVSYIILKMVLWVCNLWKPKTWFRRWKEW